METRMRSGPSLPAAILFGLLFLGAAVEVKSKVPGLFIFGDSIVDVGNNNYITGYPLLPQANIVPYGETFFHKPTGRWCNGRLVFDFVADYLSLPSPKPYLMPSSDPTRFFKGANFASAGSGILDTTFLWEGVINLSVQLQNYLKVVAQLKQQLGNDNATEIIGESIFVFITGSNDVGEYSSNTTLQQQYPAEQYIELLISKLGTDIQTAMDTGARKIFIGGMGPIGCVPRALAAINSTGACLTVLNVIAQVFDAGVLSYVTSINAKLNTSDVILGTTYNVTYNLIENGTSQGFTHGVTGCCGGGPYDGLISCGRGNYTLCSNVTDHYYWDFIHPTERVYHILADLLWDGDTTYSNPVNLRQLAGL